ncbi:MAG: dipeptide ABC transporter ATP-binding protein [Paracoccaceae bacterium]|nr:dipeptide ABC transporter ATP-binding protein [Paracoccaceae bacterium]
MSLLYVDQLNIKLGPVSVLKDVSFSLQQGEILALTGESGSGKSMTALALMQLLPDIAKTDGRILFQREDLTTKTEKELCKIRGSDISMVFQEPMTALNPVKTISAQVSETLILHKGETPRAAREKAQSILHKVGLPPSVVPMGRFPHELSGGQRQRVVIAIAVALTPSLLIADEPTTALDVTTQAQILALLKSLVKETNMAMILITHDLAVVANMADNIAIMQHGKIVEMAPTQTLFSQMHHPYTKSLFAASGHTVNLPYKAVNADNLLKVTHISRQYRLPRKHPFEATKYARAVSDVSFSIDHGERLGLVGESGCGKSTLTRAILGLDPIEKGTITLNGRDVQNAKADVRRDIQVVFQDPYGSFNPRHKVSRLVCEPYHLLPNAPSGRVADDKISRLLEDVGLSSTDKDKYIHEFSGGQRQRIAIARALIIRPKLVIFDEAVSALDVTVRAQILDLIAKLAAEYGLSYLFISHDLAVVRSVTDRCLVMRDGQIVETGRTKDILDNPTHDYTKKLINAAPKLPALPKGITAHAPS